MTAALAGAAAAGGYLGAASGLAWLRARCRVDPATECWHWRLALRDDGAPSVHVIVDGKKTNMRGRRAAIYIASGELPPKRRRAFAIDACTSADCVNPAHARLGTLREFGLWARRTGRLVGLPTKREGSRVGWEKRRAFTPEEVLAIRASDESDAALARRMNTTKASVWSARVGRTYRDVGMRVGSVFEWRPV